MRKVILYPPHRSLKQFIRTSLSSLLPKVVSETAFPKVEHVSLFSPLSSTTLIILPGIFRDEQKFSSKNVKTLYNFDVNTLWVNLTDQIGHQLSPDQFPILQELKKLTANLKSTMAFKIIAFDYSIQFLPC